MYLNILYNLIVLYSFSAYSNENWIKARNLEELNQIIRNKQQLEYLNLSCRIQLQKNKIPWACYEWMKQKEPKAKIKQNFISYFNEKCQTSSHNLNDLTQIHRSLQSPSLSRFCQTILREKKSIIEYQLRDMAPDLLFNWYFKKEF